MVAYLYVPRQGKTPFQTIIYWPGIAAVGLHSVEEYSGPDTFEAHTSTGRAFVFPILHGTFERRAASGTPGRATELEKEIMLVKDFKRTIDYLETRPGEFDMNKLAYEGLSWGANWGGVLPAIEHRVKVAVMFAGGLCPWDISECSQVDFAPHVKIPILLQDGRYDSIFPVESNQKPFLKLFGTAEQDKHYKIYETGHSSWTKNEVRKDELDFLDKYLGPAK
jgi:dienelactone hydrolase